MNLEFFLFCWIFLLKVEFSLFEFVNIWFLIWLICLGILLCEGMVNMFFGFFKLDLKFGILGDGLIRVMYVFILRVDSLLRMLLREF